MRGLIALVWVFFALMAAACVSGPGTKWEDTYVTHSGAQVFFTRCDIDVETGDYTFQFRNVRVNKNGKIWDNPKIRFDKPGLTELTGSQGNLALYRINNLSRDICVDMRERGSTQRKLAQALYDRVVRFWFDTAFEFDELNTEQEFQAEIIANYAQFEKLRAEQRAGYSANEAGN